MALVTLFGISAALFGLVTWFCATQGLFEERPPIFAFLLYVGWFAVILLSGVIVRIVDWVRH